VNDKWDNYMYRQAHNWERHALPDEVKKKLFSNTASESEGKSWFSLLSLGDEK